MTYPAWQAAYSNEAFDRAQQHAQALTDADRREGRPAPQHGYSAERFAQAEREVRDANMHSTAAQSRRGGKP